MKKIDQEELKQRGNALRDGLAKAAEQFFGKAAVLTKSGYDAVAPRVMDAVDATVKQTSPFVESVSDSAAKLTHKAGDALDRFHQEVKNDYLPRISSAVEEAAARAKEGLVLAAGPSAEELARIEKEARRQRRHRRCRRALGWTALAAAAGGVAYLVWRRSQPIEDPWAEEYWSELETDVDVSGVPAETVAAVQEAVDTAADAVADKADEAADKVKDVADKVADAVQE